MDSTNWKPHPKQLEFLNSEEPRKFYFGGYPSRENYDWIRRLFMQDNHVPAKYPLTDQELEALRNSYTYHPPKVDQPERYVIIRDKAHELARTIMEQAPHSRERAIALTQLELAVTMANKAIACNE